MPTLQKELAGRAIKEAPHEAYLIISVSPKLSYSKLLTKLFHYVGMEKDLSEAPPEAYLIISNMGNVCLGILNGSEVGMRDLNLIGDISMLDKVMVFDNEKQLIGWAPANCNRVPKSRDVSI